MSFDKLYLLAGQQPNTLCPPVETNVSRESIDFLPPIIMYALIILHIITTKHVSDIIIIV